MTRQALKDKVWLEVAKAQTQLSTCVRRQVGCVFLSQQGHVLATGYNGVAPDVPHCTDCPCEGAGYPSGEGLDKCEAIHAEQNALVQCTRPQDVHTVYCTDAPCMHCVKMLATTGAQRIVFMRDYPHPKAKQYWESLGRTWERAPQVGEVQEVGGRPDPWDEEANW